MLHLTSPIWESKTFYPVKLAYVFILSQRHSYEIKRLFSPTTYGGQTCFQAPWVFINKMHLKRSPNLISMRSHKKAQELS